jgi:hypothetical protein
MQPAAQQLAPVHTVAAGRRGPADTVRALELNGFYERRLTSPAPSTAFVTAEKIEKLENLTDIVNITGRTICPTNVYLNGVRISPNIVMSMGPGRVASNLARSPLDQLFSPSEVLAVEEYRTVEAPIEYGGGRPSGFGDCGVTLIWTK